jgi:Mlc titration factor MtfA (ptsG expression regulator)
MAGLGKWWHSWRQPTRPAVSAMAQELWQDTLQAYRFLTELNDVEQRLLRQLCTEFLAQKEFHGAQGLVVTDAMALAIAAQACLPLLHLSPGMSVRRLLRWYDDFVGIVLHPDEVLAKRAAVDDFGIVHEYQELLAGEAMDQGPVMLNWHDVAGSDASAARGYNLVIHEFAHKLDLRDGLADGCPPLPRGFLGTTRAAPARAAWFAVLEPAYRAFRERVIIAERFGGSPPWLDHYAAESVPEFFAVACEAYFVQRKRFTQEFPDLVPLFDAFFRPASSID